jgi:hypothetical protein
VLKTKTNKACWKIRVDEDFYLEVTKTMSRLIPYVKDAKRQRQRVFLKEENFKINEFTS